MIGGGFDQEAGLAVGVIREADGLKVAHRGQLAALPGELRTALRQRTAHLDGDKVREPVAIPVPVAAVRGDTQDGVGLSGGLVYLQLHVVGQVTDGSDLQHSSVLLYFFKI